MVGTIGFIIYRPGVLPINAGVRGDYRLDIEPRVISGELYRLYYYLVYEGLSRNRKVLSILISRLVNPALMLNSCVGVRGYTIVKEVCLVLSIIIIEDYLIG